ncbi:MAG TPA: sigma-70 family RNA polymerase sigma factor [Planctomycetota bacterium]|nr:sigma-70 family RNA polymerase sigma factor [Planctomycetota bacterium]
MSGVAALVDHLFRHEAGKMVATLVRILGLRNVDLAEDVVQDALLRALEVWKYRGVPENPSAWLFQAARNRAVDVLRRRKLQDQASRRLSRSLASPVDDHGVRDDQLRMMSSCAHPSLPSEGQVTVILKFLCGFSVTEIAQAFLTSEAAIEKRLARAKETLKRSAGPLQLDRERLDSIHQALYLLFSEGYHGSHPVRSVREELCAEAIRLGTFLTEHPSTATPATFALLGLMCLHAARLPSRIDDAGSLILLEAQDRSRWSRPLIDRGYLFLNHSAAGEELTAFHLEAGIAALHAEAPSFRETDWPGILKLYTHLYGLRPTPIVALNRAIALGRVAGPEPALRELEKIRSGGRLKKYPFLEAAVADLHRLAGRPKEARAHLREALSLARNEPERQVLQSRLESLA